MTSWPTAPCGSWWAAASRSWSALTTSPSTRASSRPAASAHAVGAGTASGELVGDPMSGSGTTLVEAVRSGRHAIGVDIEPTFTDIAQANLNLAAGHGATARGRVITGDATALVSLL